MVAELDPHPGPAPVARDGGGVSRISATLGHSGFSNVFIGTAPMNTDTGVITEDHQARASTRCMVSVGP